MNTFLVTVMCIAHLKTCPIPSGYKDSYQAPNKQTCEKVAKDIISGFGYAAANFRIECKEK